MNVYEFMDRSPLLAFCIAYMLTTTAVTICNRSFRHWNIRKHGYPPAHCDADGDFRPTKDGN